MTRLLVIECGVAATRAALVEDDIVRRFWFGPARGEEKSDQSPIAGRRFAARVRSVDRSLKAAFLDIGDGLDAYISINGKNESHLVEGAMIAAAVKSPPRQGKGAVLKWLDEPLGDVDAPSSGIGRLGPFIDPTLEAVRVIGNGFGQNEGRIIVDDGEARATLTAALPEADIQHEAHFEALFETYGAEAALEQAFERIVSLPGGGRIVIDEGEALTAIDVDTGALRAASPSRLREKVAFAATDEIIRQIQLRNIGGHVVVDFPPISAPPVRVRFAEYLAQAMERLPGAGGFSFSKSGLFSFTTPHKAQSLMEQFTEVAHTEPTPGRRFTLDWRAKSAVRGLEHRLRAAPSARCRLEVGLDLGAYLTQNSLWTERLRGLYGARFEVITEERLEERGFELSE